MYHNNRNMDDYLCKIMSHVVCRVCQEGFLRVIAEVGIEAEGSTGKVSITISSSRKDLQM